MEFSSIEFNYWRQRKWSDFIALAEEWLASHPQPLDKIEFYKAHFLLGLSYRLVGDTQNAINRFSQLIEANVCLRGAFYFRGNALLSSHEPDKAFADHERFIDMVLQKGLDFGVIFSILRSLPSR